MSGAKAFGEQSPTSGEDPVSWQTWSDGAGGIPDVDGDADWGKLSLQLSGAEGRSAVYDLGSAATRTFTLTLNRYGTGAETAALQIRGSLTSFTQDDTFPNWENYTAPISRGWRYVQIQETTNVLEIVFTEEFDTAGDWSTSHASIEIDGAGIKLTGAGDGLFPYMAKSFAGSPLDLTDCNWHVDFTINAGSENSDFNYIDAVSIVLIDAAANQAKWRMCNGGMTPPQWWAGANDYDCLPTIADAAYTTDLTAVTSIRLMLELNTSTATPSVTFNKITFYDHGATDVGYCVFCFDGAHAAQKRAGDYMTTKGLKGMFAVSEDIVGDDLRMTVSDLLALQTDGHMICQYPYYGSYWNEKTLQEQKDHLTANAAWMVTQGLGTSASRKIMSTPSGGRTLDEAELFTLGYVTHITGRMRSIIEFQPCSLPYQFHMGMASGVASDLETFQTGMNAARADHGVGVAVFHQTDGQPGSDMPYATFQSMVDWAADEVAAGRLIVCTPDELPRVTVNG